MTAREFQVAEWEERLAKLEAEAAALRVRIADPSVTPIDELELSVRSFNCLKRSSGPSVNGGSWGWVTSDGWVPPTNGFVTLADVAKWSRADMLRLKNFGAKSLEEIEGLLSEYGMALRS